MGLFFGNGGIFTRIGKTTYATDRDDIDVMQECDDVTYSSNGKTMVKTGDMSYLNNGKTISRCGNTYYAGGKTYTKNGNMLYGPNGKVWTGNNMTDNDVRNFIMHDQ